MKFPIKRAQIIIDQGSESEASDIEESNHKIEVIKTHQIHSFQRIQKITPIRREFPAESEGSQIEIEGNEDHIIESCSKKKLRKVSNIYKMVCKEFSNTECSICLTSFENKDKDFAELGKLDCNHSFCYLCILESSKFSTKCPYCRAPFISITKGQELIMVEEKQEELNEVDDEEDPCYICGRDDNYEYLLECERCEEAFCHTYCDERFSGDSLPEGSWYCRVCEEAIKMERLRR